MSAARIIGWLLSWLGAGNVARLSNPPGWLPASAEIPGEPS